MNETDETGGPMIPWVQKPGIYKVPHDIYHSDPVITPSLSCSIARLLVRQTPAHAYQRHARFGSIGIVPNAAMDDGSVVHALMSGHEDMIMPIRSVYGPKTKRKELIGLPVREYMTDAAKEERDEIRGLGKIPVLQHRLAELKRCYGAALKQLQAADDGACFVTPGRSEIMAVSCEDGVWFRALADRLPDDPKLPLGDLKCTEMSAAPGGWERRLQTEYAFQDAFYRRVFHGAEGFWRPPMRFGVIELEPPHGTVIMAALPALASIAEMEVERAVQRWKQCLATGMWPGYPPHTAWIDATKWQLDEADEAEQRERVIQQYNPISLEGSINPYM